MKPKLPESIRAKLSKAGKARAATFTREERQACARKAWLTRIARALAAEAKTSTK